MNHDTAYKLSYTLRSLHGTEILSEHRYYAKFSDLLADRRELNNSAVTFGFEFDSYIDNITIRKERHNGN